MNPAVKVGRDDADKILRALHRAGHLDGTRKTRQDEAFVWLPVTPSEALSIWLRDTPHVALVDGSGLEPRALRESPHAQVVAALAASVPAPLLAALPEKWEQHGDVLVLRLPDSLLPFGRDVGRAFAKVFGLKSVLHDAAGVSGELREMQATFLYGDDAVATHVENGIRYKFDASRIMFSSGNLHERMRVAALPAVGETVVDMFAGIGYFTLPLAVHARPLKIHALEKNPASFHYLQENAALNGVLDIIEPWHGDNREFPLEGIADRVHMGYVGGTRAFLPKGFALLKPKGGTLHFHDTAHAMNWKQELTRAVLDAARQCGTVARIDLARVVKTYSPGVVHAVLDVTILR